MAKIQLLHLVAVRIRGVTGGRAHFLGRRKVPTMSHVLQQQTCFRKICFEHGGPKLVSCPGRHLTPFRPCRGPYGRRNHRHKSTKNGYPYSSSHYRIGVCIWPTLEEQKNFNSTYFHVLLRKSSTDETWTTKQCTKSCCSWSPSDNWGKMKICRSIRHLKRSNKKVRWRCASYKNRY